MGGAVIMAAEAAFAAGAGKVTIVCDAKHHTAILSRAPNIMLRDINLFNSGATPSTDSAGRCSLFWHGIRS